MTIIAILSLLWMVRIFGNVASFAQLWWVKEYRWDRMLIHLKTPQGKRIYILPWKRPRISPKSIVIISATLGVLGFFIVKSGLPALVAFLLADLLSFPITFLVVGGLHIPTKLYHTFVIYRARKMLRAHDTLFVLGITGSYGKTSTKDYLFTILSKKYSALKTAASKNAPIGISEVVVGELKKSHEVFVVEMGAYKKGEVAYMAQLVRPQVGIITAINEQHQDLFGSIENTMKAKYELVANLTGKRIAILNADDTRVRVMGEWAKRDGMAIWWYGKNGNMPKGERIFEAKDIVTNAQGIQFTCVSEGKSAVIRADVVGTHQASNILAAIAGAVASGMPFAEAVRAANDVEPAHKVLEQVEGKNGLTLIDDTFNNNPNAAIAALDVLSMAKGKHFLVFQPMIELGTYAASAHKTVGAHAAKVCDAIVLTNSNWSEHFISGVRSVSDTVPVSILSGEKAATYIQKVATGKDTVLGKGKEAARVLMYLQKK